MARTIEIEGRFDLGSTVRMLKVGRVDDAGAWWWSTSTPDGIGTVRVQQTVDGVSVEAWGPGGAALVERVPTIVGATDEIGIDVNDPNVRDLLRRTAGTRLGATGAVFEVMVRAILGQVVTRREATRSWRQIVDRYGQPAPGPNTALRMFPAPEALAVLGYQDLHTLGVERRRAGTVIESARRAKRLEEILEMSPEDARTRLLAIRGVGPWTAEFVMGIAKGDKDAVTPGDYHLPNTVAYALAGEPRAGDARMFELLEPYRPERRRVVVALKVEGVHAPKYGPKTAVREHL